VGRKQEGSRDKPRDYKEKAIHFVKQVCHLLCQITIDTTPKMKFL